MDGNVPLDLALCSESFDPLTELQQWPHQMSNAATAIFIGRMRSQGSGAEELEAMQLEHYPGMTERQLAKIEAEARERWPLGEVLIIHRYGELTPGDRIVLVATTSAHRDAALESCRFLIDWLKTKAPFWKLEEVGGKTEWVEAKDADDEAAAKWNENR